MNREDAIAEILSIRDDLQQFAYKLTGNIITATELSDAVTNALIKEVINGGSTPYLNNKLWLYISLRDRYIHDTSKKRKNIYIICYSIDIQES